MIDSTREQVSKIQALITLLGDDNTSIRDVARQHLFEFGQEAEEYLRQATFADLEGKVRIEARHVLEKIRREDFVSSFYLLGLLDDQQFDLEHAVFLLARVGYPDLDSAPYRAELDELAHSVQRSTAGLDPVTEGREIVLRMSKVLHEQHGFSGNNEDYYDPDNSYLHRVLERRTGIPVSLSTLYLLIARRLNLVIRGVNLPIHFICQYVAGDDSFLFDPFHQGRLITRAECMRILQGASQKFEEHMLRPVRPRSILVRMIRNLVWIYYQRDEMEKVAMLDHLILLLRAKESEL